MLTNIAIDPQNFDYDAFAIYTEGLREPGMNQADNIFEY